jgi:hypothetical protein
MVSLPIALAMPSVRVGRALSFKCLTLDVLAIRIITHSKISPFRHNHQPDDEERE